MQIKTIKVGSLQTNCYVIVDEKSKEAVIIDPGDEAEKILPEIDGLNICYIVITHGHYDHIQAVGVVKKQTKAKILMNAKAAYGLKPDQTIKDNDEISFGSIVLKVIETPGHCPGAICLYTDKQLFSGDTLFHSTYGRVDLPGSSPQAMAASLRRLATLPDETKVFPGHGWSTTIGEEKKRGTLG